LTFEDSTEIIVDLKEAEIKIKAAKPLFIKK